MLLCYSLSSAVLVTNAAHGGVMISGSYTYIVQCGQ